MKPTNAEFAAFFAARVRPLRRTAYLLCGDWSSAEDLTQTAFARLYAAWPRLRDPAAAEAVVRITLTRAFLDQRKHSSRRELPAAAVPETAEASRPPIELRMVLMAALATLPPRQRACVVLRYFQDLTVEATAEALGCSAGTVKSNTARGLEALRLHLGPIPFDAQTGADPIRRA
jgi:RNA polymerase sigma-70 factor (sigma-E family)